MKAVFHSLLYSQLKRVWGSSWRVFVWGEKWAVFILINWRVLKSFVKLWLKLLGVSDVYFNLHFKANLLILHHPCGFALETEDDAVLYVGGLRAFHTRRRFDLNIINWKQILFLFYSYLLYISYFPISLLLLSILFVSWWTNRVCYVWICNNPKREGGGHVPTVQTDTKKYLILTGIGNANNKNQFNRIFYNFKIWLCLLLIRWIDRNMLQQFPF